MQAIEKVENSRTF